MSAPAAEPDAARIAAAALGCPSVARLDGGRFGEVTTYLPGARVAGVALRPGWVQIAVVATASATVLDLAHDVQTAVSALLQGRALQLVFADIDLPVAHGQ